MYSDMNSLTSRLTKKSVKKQYTDICLNLLYFWAELSKLVPNCCLINQFICGSDSFLYWYRILIVALYDIEPLHKL